MAGDDGVGDRKAEAKPGRLVHVARVVAPHERLEHGVLALTGDPGTVILDVDHNRRRAIVEPHDRLGAELTAFSTRLVTARCSASGRAVIMRCCGPL